jgi:hypothetical protein
MERNPDRYTGIPKLKRATIDPEQYSSSSATRRARWSVDIEVQAILGLNWSRVIEDRP